MGKGRRKLKAAREAGPTESFSSSIADPAFAAWWFGTDTDSERVTPYTILGLSAVLRSVSVISTTIAGLPLRTYERDGDERVRIESVFDDPFPGIDGLVPFAFYETVLIHLLLWREAFLWHEARDSQGVVTVYRPICPDAFQPVKSVNGKRRFTYTDPTTNEQTEVGSESLTYIPGPSIDGVKGHPWLWAARNIFAGALSGDKAAATTLRQGIRLAGLLTPADDQTDIDQAEGEEILKQLKPSVMGRENAGSIAFINRALKLTPWTPTNVESQWHEARIEILGEVGRLFGMPPHLLNDTEKQTSWGTGVAEQNLGLARFTLKGWSDRLEQWLSVRLPSGQFCEFEYKGLLQGTPAEEIGLVIEQLAAGLVSLEYACRILNLPAPNAAQRAVVAPKPPVISPPQLPLAASRVEEPDRSMDLARYAELQRRHETWDERLLTLASREPSSPTINVTTPDVHTTVAAPVVNVTTPDVHIDARSPDIRVDATTTIADGAFRASVEAPVVNVTTPDITVVEPPPLTRTVIDYAEDGKTVIGDHEELV